MQQFKILNVKITGDAPLLPHNGQLADPLNKFAKAIKAITAKRKKTDADHEQIAKLEWFGSLYVSNGLPCIPGELVEAVIINGAKQLKFKDRACAGVFCDGNYPINNGGADLSDLEKLFSKDEYRHTVSARIGKARVMRTRPIFKTWSLENVEIKYDPELLNEEEVLQALQRGSGFGDWRPKYGRFSVTKL